MGIVEPFVDCGDVLEDRQRLRARAAENGYLFFPGLLPAQEVMAIRHDVLQVAQEYHLLKPGTDPNDAIRRDGVYVDVEYERNPTPELRSFYNAVLGLRSFNAFFHHAMVLGVLDELFGEPLFVHPRVICHIVFPDRPEHTAEPHQDFAPVRGTRNTWTVWVPLGDCDAELGGIAVAHGSHRRGFLDGTSLATGEPLDERTVWHWNPFTCGDVIMFHSLTIHQGRDNATADRIRLSTSARYQPVSEPVHVLALGPQKRWGNWEQLYTGWQPNDPLKYYWKSLDLTVHP